VLRCFAVRFWGVGARTQQNDQNAANTPKNDGNTYLMEITLDVETVAIDSIQLDPANLRRHPDRNLAKIKGSLVRFGQQRPILVDGRGIVLAGNGTLTAARELGWTQIQILRTNLTGSEATAYAIADNRTAEVAEWDSAALAEVLNALRAEDADLADASGFSLNELAALVSGDPPTSESPESPDEFPEYGDDIQTEHQCPKCGYQWSGKSGA
jgi:hypothetical protein